MKGHENFNWECFLDFSTLPKRRETIIEWSSGNGEGVAEVLKSKHKEILVTNGLDWQDAITYHNIRSLHRLMYRCRDVRMYLSISLQK